MEAPDVHLVSKGKVEWQFWCTFTFKTEVPNFVQDSTFIALMRKLCRWTRVKPERLLWVCRREVGEITSRRHLHALVGGIPKQMVNSMTALNLKRAWEGLGGLMSD